MSLCLRGQNGSGGYRLAAHAGESSLLKMFWCYGEARGWCYRPRGFPRRPANLCPILFDRAGKEGRSMSTRRYRKVEAFGLFAGAIDAMRRSGLRERIVAIVRDGEAIR
jgi:hypothetical protein